MLTYTDGHGVLNTKKMMKTRMQITVNIISSRYDTWGALHCRLISTSSSLWSADQELFWYEGQTSEAMEKWGKTVEVDTPMLLLVSFNLMLLLWIFDVSFMAVIPIISWSNSSTVFSPFSIKVWIPLPISQTEADPMVITLYARYIRCLIP